MATVNLGVIKPVFKGAYNNSTAYVLDNIVTSGGSSYICILASTGNAVSNGTYWTLMAQGSDVATTLTTAGDVLYRDGSAPARLAKGTAGQALVMNSGATAPEWGSAGDTSDYVKILTTACGSSATLLVDNVFTSTYKQYRVIFSNIVPDSDNTVMYLQYIKADGTLQTSGNYRGFLGTVEVYSSAFNDDQGRRTWGSGEINMGLAGGGMNNDNDAGGVCYDMTWFDPANTSQRTMFVGNHCGHREDGNNFHLGWVAGSYHGTEGHRGFKLYWNGSDHKRGQVTVYGMTN